MCAILYPTMQCGGLEFLFPGWRMNRKWYQTWFSTTGQHTIIQFLQYTACILCMLSTFSVCIKYQDVLFFVKTCSKKSHCAQYCIPMQWPSISSMKNELEVISDMNYLQLCSPKSINWLIILAVRLDIFTQQCKITVQFLILHLKKIVLHLCAILSK